MDTIPFRRCVACHAVIEPGEQYWTRHGGPHDVDREYCIRCVGLNLLPMRRSVLGQLLEDQRQGALKRRGRR